jgi:hypothetical protein
VRFASPLLAVASLIASALLLVLVEVLVRRLEARCREDRELTVLKSASRLAVLHVIRSVLAIAAIASSLLALLALAAGQLGGEGPDSMRAAVPTLERIYAFLGPGRPLLCALLIAAVAIVLSMIAYRATRRRMVVAFEQALRRELERLRIEKERGGWEDLPSTPEMREIENTLAETLRVVQRIESINIPALAREEQLSRLDAKTSKLFEQRNALDLKRRLTLQIDFDELFRPPSRSAIRRLSSAVLSYGATSGLSNGGRLLFTLGIVALLPAWLGLEIGALREAIDRRLVQIHTRLAAQKEIDAQEKLQAARGPEVSGWEASDEQIASELARELEQAIGRMLLGSHDRIVERAVSREQILARFTKDRPEGGPMLVPSFEEANDLAPAAKEVLAVLRERKPGPRTLLGEHIKGDLRQSAQGSRKLWERFRSTIDNAEQSLSEPFVAAEIGPAVAVRVLSAALYGDELPETLIPVAQELNRDVGTEALKRTLNTKMAEFKTALVEDGSVSAASRSAATRPGPFSEAEAARVFAILGQLPRSERMDRLLADHPPSLRAKDSGSLSKAAAHIAAMRRKLANDRSPRDLDRSSEPLAVYDDLFPAQRGSHLRTQRGLMISNLAQASRTPDPFPRARSFTRLFDSAKVNGFLLGRPTTQQLDFKKLNWVPEGKRLGLVLERGDGRTVWIGAFPRSTIWTALAYAADGRPVAVTKTAAAPLVDRRIHVHPALSETAVGCRLLSLFEMLEDFGQSEGEEAKKIALSQHALYQYAWAVRADAASRNADPPQWLQGLVARYSADPEVLAGAGRALKAPLRERKRSPLVDNPDHYQRDLVEIMLGCSSAQASLTSFADCVSRSSRRSLESQAKGGRTDWIAPPPEVTVTTLAAEGAYTLDPELHFAKVSQHGAKEMLEAFEFAMQLSFDSPPRAATDAEHGCWRIMELEPAASASALKAFETDRAYLQLLTEATEMLALQRFFRAAIEGALGGDFPIERLVELEQIARPEAIVRWAMPIWDNRSGEIERALASALRASLPAVEGAPGVPRSLPIAFSRCADFITNDERGRNVAAISEQEWSQSCDLSSFQKLLPGMPKESAFAVGAVLERAGEVIHARKLRELLEIELDPPRGSERRECPPI